MCLAIPGKITSISGEGFERTGKVNFGGVLKDVNLAYTPDAKVNNYVIVHVGFAINTIDETEADKVFEYLKEMEELGGLDKNNESDGEQG